ncbi:MAG: glycosyl hydrolase 108 family protein [Candidatus Contendobacter sp.]|nr:glycosyl hydrolase 108 family protein [Candidatus Contendobacter sp.]MDG4556041.1 glycosyl hydrolase 108 family protein [Candidatus Contendobacter sp.]
MNTFEQCVRFILEEEGGLVNHPGDPGGLTRFGISQRAYPTVDIRSITEDDAKAFYRRDYWNPIHGDELPAGLDLLMLDTAINMGAETAVRLLQEALNVRVDGMIGGMTINGARQQMPGIMGRFCALRAWRYEINRNEETFGKVWFRRLFKAYDAAWALYDDIRGNPS